ncbi:hypothetical protein LTR35_000222 [Friedmanniomyces endolithicus]|uniref:Uncharacterized protein n=1 Tax=Friedmanniomyces endolithicus TaxID=329885 RepID=A0AAN6FTX2_9PEZI|nr:hypothetical protein LTS00_011060 [Friedmanniomyces endolithicus]KAK0293618.1 hypothetical protein LTR35_000222 [Friedmanniomyces endolithicus]KAK0324134.1 hypothetical protein LTR82_004570 [Friedmanniomyces endolithicus]KAK0992924.1 hypothetical protein LTR54_011244 [Friedmanniomyces endolithicus]
MCLLRYLAVPPGQHDLSVRCIGDQQTLQRYKRLRRPTQPRTQLSSSISMKTVVILGSMLPLFATSIPLTPRAGAPLFVPIPANCTIINPLPHAKCGHTGVGTVNGYMPAPNFTASHLAYAAYFDAPYNQTFQSKLCLEQCNGYGYTTNCKSALLAYQVPIPKGYYGSPGNETSPTACLLYDAYLDPNKFVAAPDGKFVNETVGSIYCP